MSPSERGWLLPSGSATAGNDSTLVGLSMPRQSWLSARIPASSVEHDGEFGAICLSGRSARRSNDRALHDILGAGFRPPAIGGYDDVGRQHDGGLDSDFGSRLARAQDFPSACRGVARS